MFAVTAAAQAQYTIRWITDPATTAIEVSGIPRDAIEAMEAAQQGPGNVGWSQLLAVYAEQPIVPGAPMTGMPPMAGTWKIVEGKLRFEPRHPLVRGVAYRAEFYPSRLPGPLGAPAQLLGAVLGGPPGTARGPVISFYELPRDRTTPSTTVLQVYPSGELLPENLRQFYVHFSAPMSRGGWAAHVELRDDTGKPVERPFLETTAADWDSGLTRLTLRLDPARLAGGAGGTGGAAAIFTDGRAYSLTIKPTWKDAGGRPLQRGFDKTFRSGPPDRTPPDPARWRLQYVPPPGTAAPVIVLFDEPMDRAKALQAIGVRRLGDNGRMGPAMDGEMVLDEQERRWMLQPVGPWRPGAYALVVGPTIEDLAGNTLGKPAGADRDSGSPPTAEPGMVTVPFEVR